MTKQSVNRLSSPRSDDEYLLDNQSEQWTGTPRSALSEIHYMNQCSSQITLHQLDLAYAFMKTG